MADKPPFNPQPGDIVTLGSTSGKPEFNPQPGDLVTHGGDISSPQDISKLESLGRGALQGATFSFAPKIAGLAGAGADVLTGATEGDVDSLIKAYEKHKAESKGKFEAARQANPYTYGTGGLLGGLGSALLTGGLLPEAAGAAEGANLAEAGLEGANLAEGATAAANAAKPTLGSSMLTGAGIGALNSAGESDADSLGGYAKDVAGGAAGGALVGGALHGIVSGVTGAVNAAQTGAKELADTTAGSNVIDQWNLGRKKISSVGKTAAKEANAEFGGVLGNVVPAVNDTKTAAGERIGEIRKTLSDSGFGVKGQDVIDDTFDTLKKLELSESQRNKVARIANRIKEVVGNKETLTPEDVSTVRKIFNNEIGNNDHNIASAVLDMSKKFSKLETEGAQEYIDKLKAQSEAQLEPSVANIEPPQAQEAPSLAQPTEQPTTEPQQAPEQPVSQEPSVDTSTETPESVPLEPAPEQTSVVPQQPDVSSQVTPELLNELLEKKKTYSASQIALNKLNPTFHKGALYPSDEVIRTLSDIENPSQLTHTTGQFNLEDLKDTLRNALGTDNANNLLDKIKKTANRLRLTDENGFNSYIRQTSNSISPIVRIQPDKLANLMARAYTHFAGPATEAAEGAISPIEQSIKAESQKLGDYAIYDKTAKLDNNELARIQQNIQTSSSDEATQLDQYIKTAMQNSGDRVRRNAALFALMQNKTFRDTASKLTGVGKEE